MEVEDDTECRLASKEVQENLVESLQHQLQEVEKKRTISCLSTKECTRSHKRYKASRTREKYAERELGGKRRNVEHQRRN